MPARAQTSKPERYDELLCAAAECFQKQGFAATSIDTVARHVGATKGRVYHYFPSKMDLFNAVRDRAMELVFDAIRPALEADLPVIERLTAMSLAHTRVMMRHHSYMQVLLDGLQMQRFGATTEFQRQAMQRHLQERDDYETCFREVLQQGVCEGVFQVDHLSITLQSFLIALNGPVFWYRPRPGDNDATHDEIAGKVVRYAMAGLGVGDLPVPSTTSERPSERHGHE